MVAFAGVLDASREILRQMGIQAAWSIAQGPCSLDEAIRHSEEWLRRAATTLGDVLALPK